MNINEMKYGEVIELKKQLGVDSGAVLSSKDNGPYEVGKNYFIRTVTHHFTGKLIGVYRYELVFESCAWIADDGRFADSMKDFDNINEVEPYPKNSKVIIGRGALIDAHATENELPTEQK